MTHPKVGGWYRHTVGDHGSVLRVVRIDEERVYFHDHTWAYLEKDMSYLVPCDPPKGSQ